MRRYIFTICFLSLVMSDSFSQNRLPNAIPSGPQEDFHIQGIVVDQKNGFVYMSFTDKLIKTDLKGNLIGSVTGFIGHLGDLAFDSETGKVYGSLEYKDDAIGKGINRKLGVKTSDIIRFYVAIFNGSEINRPGMNAEKENVVNTVYLDEPVKDYNAEVRIGERVEKHRYGCSGIDGITVGPAIGDNNNSKKFLYVAYGIYGDTTREDNNYQVILKYDTDKWNKYQTKLLQESPHHSGPKKPDAKYFLKTGNTTYGIQNLAYDSYTGNFFAAVYPGKKNSFPNYHLFVIDGKKKPFISKIFSDNKLEKVETLSLVQAGEDDETTGIRGWNFEWGSTGLFPLGNGLFYISHNNKINGRQAATIKKYRWLGGAKNAFELVR